MIFDVHPSQIENLDSKELVILLKKLLHAEAQRAGINLSGISVPLQITVPDGGEDARISWQGGFEHTDYLPSRFCIFQSKASDPGPSGWKKEVWTKNSQKKDDSRILNNAVKKVIAERGSYIGFTSATVIGGKYDRRIEGIKQGIREAGSDPARLKAIKIYDANKIAAWASRHPAVAVWLNERQSGLVLKGFQTVEYWGKKAEISSIQHVDDKARRFSIGEKDILGQQGKETPGTNTLTFHQTKERIADYLADSMKSLRVLGASGVGKTRFVYEVFKDEGTIAKMVLSTSAIYCDYRDIGQQVLQIAQSLSDSQSSTLMTVDECPREIADRLGDIVMTEDGSLRVLTIGNDDRPIEKDNCLNISVLPADDDLVEGVIRQRLPNADNSDISFIKNLCGGYPRIAVLATDNYSEKAHILKSVEDIVERILTGCNITRSDQVRAIECLSLFNRLGVDEELSGQIDLVAETLARQTGDEMYEHLAHASKHHLVERRGPFFIAQPLPIAAFLGARRIDTLRIKTILHFIEIAPPDLLYSFLNQWRHFDVSRTAVTLAERLLARDGRFGSLEQLNTELGLKCLDALVHVSPDVVSDTLSRVFGTLTVDQLGDIKNGKHYLVWALQKLVFRKSSFLVAARLLMRLSASENKTGENHVTGLFKQLFQLHLSGTEAEPQERLNVLDEGLISGDDRIVSACIEALGSTLKRGHFTRSGGFGQIGTQPPLKDWQPKLWSEVFNFHREGLKRLDEIRSKHEEFSERCEIIIATHIRALLIENLLSDIETVVRKIAKEKGVWIEAIRGVGDWLYFDRKNASKRLSKKVRDLYDSLLPTDPVQSALLYTKFWSANIRDPDLDYDRDDSSTRDYEYSSRNARVVAAEIATDKKLTDIVIQTMAVEELHNVFPFSHELAMRVDDPVKAFKTAVNAFEASVDQKGLGFVCGMLTGIDERDKEAADTCMEIALNSQALEDQSINLYSAVRISRGRLSEIVKSLQAGIVAAEDCVFLSYGRKLDDLSAEDILPLLDELASNHESDGIWTALEITTMYQHGRAGLDKHLAGWIKQQIASRRLFGKVRKSARDGDQFEELTLLINKYFGIDDEFARELSMQITRLCQVDDHKVFSAFDHPARQIIKLLVNEKPRELWDVISRFFEIGTELEMHRLEDLVGPPGHDFDGEGHNMEGALFGIPETDCIEWAKSDPENQSPFLCLFYPLFDMSEKGKYRWHPALERISAEFGTVQEFRHGLADRLHPRLWSGSIVPHLEVYLEPLKTWFNHPVSQMSVWARETHRQLERQIAAERKREDENLYW